MSRDLSTDLREAIEESLVKPFMAVLIDLPDPVYAWTGQGTITFNDAEAVSRDWLGTGGIGAIDSIDESTDGSATGVKVTLFGRDGMGVSALYAEDIAEQATRGAKFEVYLGAIELGPSWHVVKATKLIWRGRVDKYEITDAGETLTVQITAESRAIDQRRPAIKRFTDEYQQRQHLGDLFFQYVPQMVEIPILWAKAEQNSTSSGSGGGGSGGLFLPSHV